nr:hypothetical protein [Tanacetum cinerariifolium]
MALTFADTHNMIAFLTKSDASEGFDQIVDFLNAHVIQYALMVNPTIYVSCIKQFWTFVSIKKTNDVVRLQALIDRKKVIITEDTIRQALLLDDAAGVDCLQNEEIFAELARMGYEKPLVRNVDSPSNFLMYLRFLQLIIHAQIADLSSHTTKYTSPALTQKVFANTRMIGKGFSGVDTPLFDGMLVPQQAHDVEDATEDDNADNEHVANLEQDKIAQAIEITKLKQRVRRLEKKRQFKSSGLKRLRKVETAQKEVDVEVTMDADVQGRLEESQSKVYHLDLEHAEKILSMQDNDEAEPAEVKEVIEVVIAAKLMTEVVTIVATPITNAQVPKASAPRRRRGVIIQDLEETATASVIMHSEAKTKDKGKAKKQRINEETKELKTHLQIVANDDDVYTEATPLALKVPVVDYQIYHEYNKHYYKIIGADGTHQLFLSFVTLLKNFDREDLEIRWKLVQERFQSSEPNNFSDDFLLNTLKIMFEKPNVEASIWRDQRDGYGLAKVKS